MKLPLLRLAHISLPRPRALLCVLFLLALGSSSQSAQLRAGVGKAEITDRTVERVNDPLYVKALVIRDEISTVVLITVDAVAIGEIGRIGNDFLANVRGALQKELGIAPASVVINASHCHGVVRADTEALTIQAVKEAWQNLVEVRVGAGSGQQDQISENRRLKMKDGSEVDMRRAYSLPRDEDVAAVGPIDPQIGLLRIDRLDHRPFAVVYNFACHPIMNPPNTGNSADFPGVASKAIEESLGGGAMAFFVQGCAGDINPVRYKDVQNVPSAEPLGNRLGLSVLGALKGIETQPDAELKIISQTISVPRGADLEQRIARIGAEQTKLLQALKPTDINFKAFLPLLVAQRFSPDYPSGHLQGYLHEKAMGRDDLSRLDTANRKSVDTYLENIQVMERLTRLNVNLALLKKHLVQNQAAGKPTLEVEIAGIRIGNFRLVTFPGELTVETGLNLKRQAAAPFSFVAGYCNGYIYYLPTEKQRGNTGYAQEDCDCLVSADWQKRFESKALEVLKGL